MFIPLALLLAGCPASVMPLYDQARSEALAAPGPAPAGWKPDLVLHLSGPVIQDVARETIATNGALKQRIDQQVLGATVSLTPDLTIHKVKVSPSEACGSCLAIDTTVSGKSQWAAFGQRGEIDLRVHAIVDLQIEAKGTGGVFDVTVAAKDVDKLDVTVSGAQAKIGDALQALASDQLRRQLLAQFQPIDLGTYGNKDTPLRALRAVGVAGGGVQIEMLSSSPSPGVLSVRDRPLAQGFALYADPGSVVGLARAEAFKQPPLTHDVVVEPTSLTVGDDTFDLGIRLWRPVGRGWWRDYTVSGALSVFKGHTRLDAKSVSEGEKSAGAEIVDPLVTLGEGVILQSISDAVHANIPSRTRAVAGGVRIDALLTGITGDAGMLIASGTIDAGPVQTQAGGSAKTRPR